ncbi:butyrophilin subfamily 2 member A2-like [Liasis olivaceus]
MGFSIGSRSEAKQQIRHGLRVGSCFATSYWRDCLLKSDEAKQRLPFRDMNKLIVGSTINIPYTLKVGVELQKGSPFREEALGLIYWESRLKADLQLKLFFFSFLLFSLTANVILDPETAHPGLSLSMDRKNVTGIVINQYLPQNPKRFQNGQYVLGYQGFSTGRHFWEVTVGNDWGWAVGIAKKSVNRKNYIRLCPEEGMWQFGKWEGKYKAILSQECSELPLTTNLKRIRVSLNFEGGQVTFFDAETAALLYTFSEAALAGETLLPSFLLNNYACLTLAP